MDSLIDQYDQYIDGDYLSLQASTFIGLKLPNLFLVLCLLSFLNVGEFVESVPENVCM